MQLFKAITFTFLCAISNFSIAAFNYSLKVAPQGFYNATNSRLNMKDTVRLFLKQPNAPFLTIDSAIAIVDSVSLNGNFTVHVNEGFYYLAVKHRNSILTWSSSPVYVEQSSGYDFTPEFAQAYGNNLIPISNKYCIYSGDTNQDGAVDVTDLIGIFNAGSSFSAGYIETDLTGDRLADLTDLLIAYNNSNNFVEVSSPDIPQPPCNLTFNRTINWSGFTWFIASSNETKCGPGPNYFSSSNDNVWVDGTGDLHLKITKRNGKFYCAELFTAQEVDYGLYTFYLSSRVDQIDKNAVLGLFTWNDLNCVTNANSEIDIEFTRWSDASNQNLLEYSVQPTNAGQENERYHTSPMNLTGNYSIHFFNWTPTLVSFSSYKEHTNPPLPSNMISSWSFDTNNPPRVKEDCNSNPVVIPDPEENTTLNINLWLDRGHYPSNNQEVEVIVHKVQYTPMITKP